MEQPCYIAEGVDIPDEAYIGAFAHIGEGVRLGKGVMIYPQAYVGDNVEIGEGTVVRAGVRIYEGCRIGSRCVIHSGAVIGADGFGFAPRSDGSYEKIPQTGSGEVIQKMMWRSEPIPLWTVPHSVVRGSEKEQNSTI